MYQLVVGEGGVSPDYFLERMTIPEAKDFIKGLSRRSRESWEQTRMVVRSIYLTQGCDAPGIRFPWDEKEEEVDEPMTAEELKNLNEKAKAFEKLLDK